MVRINTVLRIVFNQAPFTSARCIWHSTNYATRGTISPPRKKKITTKTSSSLSFLLGTEIFHWRSFKLSNFWYFWWLQCKTEERSPLTELRIILWKFVPPSPIKKEDECASSLPSRSQGKTLRTSFLEEKAAVKGQRRKVGNRIFFKDVTNKQPKLIIKWTDDFGFYFTSSLL